MVSHPPLTAELGAAQIAVNLADALRTRGHDAIAWSPEPLPPGTHRWDVWRQQRRAIERFVAAAGPFDVVDTPAVSATAQLARRARLVVRSIQPELLYLLHDLRADLGRRPIPSPRTLINTLVGGARGAAIVGGWRRAHVILCLGSWELAWMRRRLPWLEAKLGVYVCAPPAAERGVLAEVRRGRPPSAATSGTRFLWIGRWAAHKGTRRLIRFLQQRARTHPCDTFTLAGCGPAARHLPSALLAEGQLRLVPSFGRNELLPLLAAHDAGLFTSVVEGWGLSLNEMLEAGLTVYATAAGAVIDLRPFWGDRLRPFPPPPETAPAAPPPDLEGYLARFSWPEIARSYEEQALR